MSAVLAPPASPAARHRPPAARSASHDCVARSSAFPQPPHLPRFPPTSSSTVLHLPLSILIRTAPRAPPPPSAPLSATHPSSSPPSQPPVRSCDRLPAPPPAPLSHLSVSPALLIEHISPPAAPFDLHRPLLTTLCPLASAPAHSSRLIPSLRLVLTAPRRLTSTLGVYARRRPPCACTRSGPPLRRVSPALRSLRSPVPLSSCILLPPLHPRSTAHRPAHQRVGPAPPRRPSALRLPPPSGPRPNATRSPAAPARLSALLPRCSPISPLPRCTPPSRSLCVTPAVRLAPPPALRFARRHSHAPRGDSPAPPSMRALHPPSAFPRSLPSPPARAH